MARSFAQLTESEKESRFYLPKPRILGVRAWSLLIPAVFSVIGFGAFAVLAYSFTEVQTLPVDFRRILVLIGAFSLAVGAEIGTLPAVVEIFRKAGSKGKQKVRVWDWAGLVISAIATLASFLFAFATLLGERTNWSQSVQVWGAIVLGLFAAADSYVTFAEFGLYLSTFDDRMELWEKKYAKWRQDMAEVTGWARGETPKERIVARQPEIRQQAIELRERYGDPVQHLGEMLGSLSEDQDKIDPNIQLALDRAHIEYLHSEGSLVPEIASVTDFTIGEVLDIIRKGDSNGTDVS